ncbi:Ran-binding domain-containing protein [Aspergillus saccharolyticus JOP 1030-1]|uniref:Nuclear protein export protein Yrb2 n=1 Tax=Aspergillus saccharolyticus JOP 1030-1 TaxID=1450539 RepID=A0A318ZIW9_9EURO|nr:nuclear protein export protein Yrb2 [Aspergillus saccharolyticus JOP 1030-1]PYH47521.1 nuclear protein export protein Yrb2 [Aspergillus saccharolyticus JOP 1030-1]
MASEQQQQQQQQHDIGAQVGEAPQSSVSAQVAEDSQASDNDGGERPVRNKLKETSITSVNKADDACQEDSETSRASSRGRKRSYDEDQPEKMEEDSGHRRKRSRDSNTEEENTAAAATTTETESQPAEDLQRKILSPKKKRSRDQLDKDETKPAEATEQVEQSTADKEAPTTEKSAAEGEPEKKRHRDDSQEREKVLIPSGFANTSSVSPFGVLGAGASKQESADPSAKSSAAFAASGLAAFAKTDQSPFGTFGSSTSSVFKSQPPSDASKPAPTGFAAAAGKSGFASLGAGFAGFSGGFGSAAPKSAITSLASPVTPSVLGSKKPSAFGQPENEEGEEGDAEETNAGPGEFEQDKTDERFFERPIETGEENEKTYFSCKAKLFQFSNKEWKERGIGTFKVNVRVTDGVEDKKAARMIMRADGVLRVMLNTPIFKGMTVGDATGQPPKSKQIHLASLEEGRSVPLLLRTGNEELAKELYNVVKELQSHQ